MGALSALVVGACMTAPLFAVLAFIAHTGRRGARRCCAVFDGVGLGVPLLIIGLGAGTLAAARGRVDGRRKGLLRRRAACGAALWIVWPVLGGDAQMLLSALWLLIAAAALGLFSAATADASIWRRLGRGFGAALAIWAAMLLVGSRGRFDRSGAPARGVGGARRRKRSRERRRTARPERSDVRAGALVDGTRSGGQSRRAAGDAGFLCGLVRLLQGDGEI